MGTGFWDQVHKDTSSLVSTGEVSIPFLILDGEHSYQGTGIFEHSYREIQGEGEVPIPSTYVVMRVYEADMPVRIKVGMSLVIGKKLYEISGIREPGKNGITTLELIG